MRSVKITDRPEFEKIIIKKKLEEDQHGISYAAQKLSSIFTVKKYFVPFQLNFFVGLKTVSHFYSQNLEVIDHLVPEIKNYYYRHMAYSHLHLNILPKLYAVTQEKVENMDMCFYNYNRWSFLPILT